MSQLAYERLLEANTLLEKGDRDGAITAYRDVLRLSPSPPQRQVAEAQLRDLGELPYTFANSGKVIRRRSEGRDRPPQRRQQRDRRDDTPRQDRPPQRRDRDERPPRQQRDRGWQPRGQQDRRPPQGRSFERSQEREPRPRHGGDRRGSDRRANERSSSGGRTGGRFPQTNSERALSKLHDLFNTPQSERPTREKRGKQRTTVRGKQKRAESTPLPIKRSRPIPIGPKPYPPVKREDESDKSFVARVKRYNIWKGFQKEFPGMDINIANRLKQDNITYNQLRKKQYLRYKRFVRRKKARLAELREENAAFKGTNYLQQLSENRTEICAWALNQNEWRGRLHENKIYDVIFRPYLGKRKRLPKLDLFMLYEREAAPIIRQVVRVEEAQLEKQELPSRDRSERFELTDADLEKSMEKEQFLYFRGYNGAWIRAIVQWFDPYQIGFLCKDKGADGEEYEVEGLLFRHAVNKLNKRRPAGWNDLPTPSLKRCDGARPKKKKKKKKS